MILILLLSYFAGILTVLAPCTLPILPLIIGGSAGSQSDSRRRTMARAAVIITSLAVSIIVFTLLLKASTALLGVPAIVWKIISGGIVLVLGVHFLFPELWMKLSLALDIEKRSRTGLMKAQSEPSSLKNIFIGAALGPVFSSCSPTYALIVAAILPTSFALGIIYLFAYVLGMATLLLLVAYFGARLIKHLGWALDERGVFRRVIGVIFVVLGLAIVTGFDKSVETWLLERGVYDGTSGFEQLLH